MGQLLTERLFRLMDANKDGFLNFKELVQALALTCKGDHVRKLKLLYCLHLPGVVLPGELEEATGFRDATDGSSSRGACDEEAVDAEAFFDGKSKEIGQTAEGLKGIKIGGKKS